MKLKLTLTSGDAADDILVSVDATATAGQVAERLRISHPRSRTSAVPGPTLCLRVNPGTTVERTVYASTPLGEADIRNGDVVALANASGAGSTGLPPVATCRVLRRPDACRTFNRSGATTSDGRDRSCAPRLSDLLGSTRHA